MLVPVAEHDALRLAVAEIDRVNVGTVGMTVEQNVAFGLKQEGAPRKLIADRVQELLKLVRMERYARRKPEQLSGGQRQRVALARALATQPTILLLDEPLSALDEKIRREMQNELKHIQRQTATTFLYVTHDQEEALTMSDRIAVLNNGVCVQCDTPERLYRKPRTRFVAQFFRGCNVIDSEVLDVVDRKARLRFGRQVIEVAPENPDAIEVGRAGVAIRAENLRFGESDAQQLAKIQAELTEVVYRGTNIDYLLELDDGQKLTATATRRHFDGTPQTVMVSFNPNDLIVLED